MKKIRIIILIFLITFSLAGCELFSELFPTITTSVTTTETTTISSNTTNSTSSSSSTSTTSTSISTSTSTTSTNIPTTDTTSTSTTKKEETTTSSSITNTSSTTSKSSTNTTNSTSSTTNTGSEAVLELNSNNSLDETKTLKTKEFSGYTFEYENTYVSTNSFTSFSFNGSFKNETEFSDIDSITIYYSIDETSSLKGFGDLYYFSDYYYIENPQSNSRNLVSSGFTIEFDDDPRYFALYSFNTVIIEKIIIEYKEGSVSPMIEDYSIQIIGTNDIHGQVDKDSSRAGLVEASGYIEEIKEDYDYNILLDQGDIYQGSLASYLTNGNIMSDFLTINGYDTTILGNHEWDWGENKVKSFVEYSETKYISCNIRYRDNDKSPSWVSPYTIIKRGDIKIGLIGMEGDCYNDISSSKVRDIYFVTGESLNTLVLDYINELKDECDFIILQIHDGATGESLAKCYSYLDFETISENCKLIMESHTHYGYSFIDEYGILHAQAGGYLTGITNCVLNVTHIDNKPVVVLDESIHSYVKANIINECESDLMRSIKNYYKETVYGAVANEKVGQLSTNLTEEPVDDYCAQAYYNLINVCDELKDYDICMGGGCIQCRSPKKLTSGSVIYSDVANLYPFDNDMLLVKLRGDYLKSNFYARVTSGNSKYTNTYHIYSPELTYNTIDTTKYYYFITDSYNYDYWYGKASCPEIIINLTEIYNIYPRDVFSIYLKQNTLGISTALTKQGGQTPVVNSTITFELNYNNCKVNTTQTSLSYNDTSLIVYHSSIVDKSSFYEFGLSTNGYITIDTPNGYSIKSLEMKIYQVYDNIDFYESISKEEELTKTKTEGSKYIIYKVDVNGNSFYVDCTRSTSVYYLKFTLQKTA